MDAWKPSKDDLRGRQTITAGFADLTRAADEAHFQCAHCRFVLTAAMRAQGGVPADCGPP